MDPDPSLYLPFLLLTIWTGPVLFSIIGVILLIVASGLISGSEVAFFSITPTDTKELEEEKTRFSERILKLRSEPQKLLATILITNNLVNIMIILLSDYVLRQLLPESVFMSWGEALAQYIPLEPYALFRLINFLITVLGVTFILVLFGEILPKVYANVRHLSLAKRMAGPMSLFMRLFSPISNIMVSWGSSLEQRVEQATITDSTKKDDLEQAIEFSVDQEIYETDEADLLKGIINFGEVSVKQIMKSRMDIVGIELNTPYTELMDLIKSSGFSRLPVFNENLDAIEGILYVKDLLGLTKEDKTFEWQALVRDNIMYVPETKKIDELLKEFQVKRLHLAIAVDEFGGTSGLVTLEDIMEEIIGEIKDEFDDEREVEYVKIDEDTFIFDGKVLLNDACRVMQIDLDIFDKVKGASDSLAGLILELKGSIPKKSEKIQYDNFAFHIREVSKRRIKEVKIEIERSENE